MNDARMLWKAIAADPREDTPKLALADLYQEQGGLAMERAIRWCVARRVRPLVASPRRVLWLRQNSAPGKNHLPRIVFDAMPPRDGISPWLETYHAWCSLEAALRAVSRVLVRLRTVCEVPA